MEDYKLRDLRASHTLGIASKETPTTKIFFSSFSPHAASQQKIHHQRLVVDKPLSSEACSRDL